MKVLLDTCVWGKARDELQAAGHNAVWVGDSPSDPGDDEILAQAHRDDRILITSIRTLASWPLSMGGCIVGFFAL